MKNELFILRELRKEILIRNENQDDSLSGKTGHCFIKGDKVIKIYDSPLKIKDLCDLTGYHSNHISFPIDYIYEKSKVVGEILPYYHAETIDNVLNIRSNANSFINYYSEIECEIKRFPNIKMNDMWMKNILYSTRKGFYLIDTSDWKVSEEDYYAYNIKLLDNCLFYLLRNLMCDCGNNREFFNYLCDLISDGESLLEILKEFIEDIRIKYNYEVKSLSNIKKYIK